MEYLLHILVLIGIYTVLSVSLDLLVGHMGLLSVAHAGFFGLGAYTSAILALRIGTPTLLGVIIGMTVAAIISLLFSLPSLRLRDDYFVIATFGSQMILFSVFNNWVDVTRGPLGIANIPQLTIFGWAIQSQSDFVVIALFLSIFSYGVVARISTSPFGRVLRAIREDEDFARAFGKNTKAYKVMTFCVSAALAASAGSLYAHYITYIDPTSFTVMESILVISMVIIGGAGSRWGPVVGAVALVSFPELLRFAGLPSSVSANLRQIFYGGLLLLLMMVRPQGLFGRYRFRR